MRNRTKLRNFSNTMTTSRNIITFSGRMRSGKGVLAKAMEKAYGAKTFSMATHLKNLCVEILNMEDEAKGDWTLQKLDEYKNSNEPLSENPITLSESSIAKISEVTGIAQEKIVNSCENTAFQTVRDILQIVGTDIIRQNNPDWHVWKTIHDIGKLPEDTIVCVDDVRFPNELKAFKYAGAISFFIIRNNAEILSNHESETSLHYLDFPDNRIILNINSENELCKEFVAEFENGFNQTVNKPIFLIDYTDYRNVNRKFATEKTPLVEEIVRQNSKNDLFLKDGLITFRNNMNFKLKEVLENMGITESYRYEQKNGRFVINNPLVYENLKIHI